MLDEEGAKWGLVGAGGGGGDDTVKPWRERLPRTRPSGPPVTSCKKAGCGGGQGFLALHCH